MGKHFIKKGIKFSDLYNKSFKKYISEKIEEYKKVSKKGFNPVNFLAWYNKKEFEIFISSETLEMYLQEL